MFVLNFQGSTSHKHTMTMTLQWVQTVIFAEISALRISRLLVFQSATNWLTDWLTDLHAISEINDSEESSFSKDWATGRTQHRRRLREAETDAFANLQVDIQLQWFCVPAFNSICISTGSCLLTSVHCSSVSRSWKKDRAYFGKEPKRSHTCYIVQ